MEFRSVALAILAVILTGSAVAAEDTPGAPPEIGEMSRQQDGAVCRAWVEGGPEDAGLVWITFSPGEKPFGMRGFVKMDNVLHAMRQIAYAGDGNGFSIHYRTLGYRNYDVRLEMSGPPEDGAELTGKLVASRFGLFSEVKIAGSCGKGGG